MPELITAKIDVTKIDKARLFQGQKGTYLDVVLIPTRDGKFGDYMVVQSVTKEERQAGVRGPILGNAKEVGGGNGNDRSAPPPRGKVKDDDIPF